MRGGWACMIVATTSGAPYVSPYRNDKSPQPCSQPLFHPMAPRWTQLHASVACLIEVKSEFLFV